MRILFIVYNLVGQGTFFRANGLARGLNAAGHSVTILASSPFLRKKPRIQVLKGIEIIEVSDLFPGPTRSGWDLTNLISRLHILNSRHYDVIHGFESRPTVIYPALKMKQKVLPLFLDWADWFGKRGSVEERPSKILRAFLRPIETYYETHFRHKANGTSVICKTLKDKAIDLGVSEESISLLPNGFNVDEWDHISRVKARKICNLDDKSFYIGYLGSLFPSDAKLMADSINDLHKRDPRIRLIHIGHSNYHVKQLVMAPESVIEMGPQGFNEMQTCLSACDILWLPLTNNLANQGRFPLKFTNYIACGRPIVSTNVGDIPNYIKKYDVGIVTDDTAASLSDTVIILSNNPSIRDLYGNNAIMLSNNASHNWTARAKKLEKLYEKQSK